MIDVICLGKIKESYLTDLISDYEKRISKYTKISIKELKDNPNILVEEEESCARKVADAGIVCHNEELTVDLIALGAVGIPPRIGEIYAEIVEIVEISARCESRELFALIEDNVKVHRSGGNTVTDA